MRSDCTVPAVSCTNRATHRRPPSLSPSSQESTGPKNPSMGVARFALCTLTWACAAALGSCHGGGASGRPVSLAIVPDEFAVAKGRGTKLTARAVFVGGRTEDWSAFVDWSSADAGICAVARDGSSVTVSALAEGSTTVRASVAALSLNGSVVLTVLPAALVSIEVTPTATAIPKGTDRQFSATGIYTDQTSRDLTEVADWGSSNGSVATVSTISGTRGRASGIAAGTTTIRATEPTSGIAGSTELTVTAATLVSIAVTPANPSVALGLTRQMSATGTFTDSTVHDLTATVDWTSSAPSVASITGAGPGAGLAAALAVGSTTVRAVDSATGIQGATTLTVSPAALVSLQLTPTDPSVPLGLTQQFTATGSYTDSSVQDLTSSVTWSSSSPSVATVSDSGGTKGLASTVAVGSTTVRADVPATSIFATTGLTVSPATLVSLAVTPADSTLPLGLTRQFTATGTYTDASNQDLTTVVTWTSTVPSTATISNAGGTKGLATSVAAGSTTVRATDPGTGTYGTTSLTVSTAALVSIAVTPATPSIAVGLNQQFTATGTYSDSSNQDLTAVVTWASSATSVATVSNAGGTKGLASSVAVGVTTIGATDPGTSITGNTSLTVTGQVAFRGASSAGAASGITTLVLATPVGTVAGDVMVAAVAIRPDTATITPPAGWTLLRRVDNSNSNANSLAVYQRTAAASEPASHSFTFSSSTGSAGGIQAFGGVDAATPIDAHDGQTTASGLTHAAPSITTSVSNTMLVTFHTFSSSATWTPPGGMTEAFDVSSDPAPAGGGISLEGTYDRQSSPGATGARTATASNDADVGNGIAVALRRQL